MAPEQDSIEKIIATKKRRLQKLREQQALKGVNTEPEVLIEIEDLEAELEQLGVKLGEEKLAELPVDGIPDPAPLPPGSRMPLSANPLFVGRKKHFRRLAKALLVSSGQRGEELGFESRPNLLR